jgi:exonuclease I
MSEFKINKKSTGLFAAGVLFGTAGIRILSSKDAKKLYTNCTAAVLRAKECVMKTVTTIQENAEDIYEDAKEINEERAAEEEAYEDIFEDEDDEEEAPSEESTENGDAGEA